MAKPGKRYPPEVKQKIIAATKAARDAAKPWTDAHKAAQEAGYKGSQAALQQMMMPKKLKAKGAKPGPKPGRKRGRPAKQDDSWLPPVAAQKIVSAIDAAMTDLAELRKKYAK